MAIIRLNMGRSLLHPARIEAIAIVDDEDFDRINAFGWYSKRPGKCLTSYAFRMGTDQYGNKKLLAMHREVMGAGRGQVVDHINHDGLDNRKANLRLCTPSENSKNHRYRTPHVKFQFKNKNLPWEVRIQGEFIGTFATEPEAIAARDAEVKRRFGKMPRLVQPPFPAYAPPPSGEARIVAKASGNLVYMRPRPEKLHPKIDRKVVLLPDSFSAA